MRAALLLLLLMIAPLAAAEPWRDDLAAALDEARSARRPLVLLVGSDGCVWCQRLLSESAEDPAARRALAEVVPVHVRAEDHRGLLVALDITAFPTLVLVNRKGRITRLVRGYLPSADLATTVRVLVQKGDEVEGQALPADAGHPTTAAGALAVLGGDDPAIRQEARALLAGLPAAAPQLWPLLDDRRLTVRIDAAAALAAITGRDGGYDPFAPDAERRAQAAAWRQAATGAMPEVP